MNEVLKKMTENRMLQGITMAKLSVKQPIKEEIIEEDTRAMIIETRPKKIVVVEHFKTLVEKFCDD